MKLLATIALCALSACAIDPGTHNLTWAKPKPAPVVLMSTVDDPYLVAGHLYCWEENDNGETACSEHPDSGKKILTRAEIAGLSEKYVEHHKAQFAAVAAMRARFAALSPRGTQGRGNPETGEIYEIFLCATVEGTSIGPHRLQAGECVKSPYSSNRVIALFAATFDSPEQCQSAVARVPAIPNGAGPWLPVSKGHEFELRCFSSPPTWTPIP